jgi:hypothetical protein
MPRRWEITADGKRFEVTAPDDMPQDEVRRQFEAQQQPSQAADIGRGALRGLIGAIEAPIGMMG